MELGLDLEDDSLFEFSREGRTLFTQRCDEYAVKQCHPLWFKEIDLAAAVDADKILKFQGDLAYRNGDFTEALEFYEKCQNKLSSNNTSTWRGVEEDRARCLLRLSRYKDAIDCAANVVESAQNVEHVTSALRLLADISRATRNSHDERVHVKKLLLLHPHSPQLWIRLGYLFKEEQVQSESVTFTEQLGKNIPDIQSVEEQLRERTMNSCRHADSFNDCSLEYSHVSESSSFWPLQRDIELAFISFSAALLTLQRVKSASLYKETNSLLIDQVNNELAKLKVSQTFSEDSLSLLRSALAVDEEAESTSGCLTVQSALQILRGNEEEVLDVFRKKYLASISS